MSSFDWLGSAALTPIGFALIGPLAQIYSARTILLAAATLVLIAGLSILAVPSVRDLPLEPQTPTDRN